MGKAGIAMRKFSATLCSLGVPSCYLHPGEALHGDLGLIRQNDIIFVASTSGKTSEVIQVIDLILPRRIDYLTKPLIIGLTSHPDSLIREKADIVIDMGEIEEAGVLKLAPTTSIIIMQAITDSIALCVSEMSNFKAADYAMLHHSGYLNELAKAKEKTQ